jgi:[protein-PII] uridylyltransferase
VDLADKKNRASDIRQRAAALQAAGIPGIQIAATLCELMDRFVVDLVEDAFADEPEDVKTAVRERACVVAVGGTGRGELCPDSDLDLLFLDETRGRLPFRDGVTRIVQSCWDAKLGLGHSVRTIRECVAMARQDCEIATSLIEARLVWGSEAVFDQLRRQFRRRVVDARRGAFVQDCIAARAKEFPEPGDPAQQLEPNVKRSLGGLRDLHLIRWIGFATFGAADLDTLRLNGGLSMDEAHAVRSAWEYLTRIRIDLHLSAGRAQDLLTRDEQLRIAGERGFPGTAAQRPVEQFMQEYFRHSTALARVARRFSARFRARSAGERFASAVFSHRTEGIMRVMRDELDAAPRHLARLCRSLESVLRLYRAAAFYGILPSIRLVDAIESAARGFNDDLSAESAALFMDILRCRSHLGPVLRSMYETGVLEHVIPDVRHTHCLMQFNQYHSYTVDEHSLRAVETASRYREGDGPIGAAYESLKHKEILHLALLLHDLGKGFEEDHWEVGRRIADRVAQRLRLSPRHREQLMFLVHRHLDMAHNALRRDLTDPELILQFSHDVGTPETLSMLYVLTAADITAVGPGAWTSWKDELLTELYNRCQLVLSGTRDAHDAGSRLREVRERVAALVRPPGRSPEELNGWGLWLDRQLDGFSAYYLTCTPAERIAADLRIIRELSPDDVRAIGQFEAETGTVEYRVLTRNPRAAEGCFHKLSAVLTAKRHEILSADISTTREGVVIDSFRVIDRDFDGHVPPERLEEVAAGIEDVLRQSTDVEKLFLRHRRFGSGRRTTQVSNLPLRVEVDNDSSDSRTIIDVFAHDRPGLLYSLARTLYELNLSVDLARISTHYDQVVDVFYVRELDGRKVRDPGRLESIRSTLVAQLDEFERTGHRRFVM